MHLKPSRDYYRLVKRFPFALLLFCTLFTPLNAQKSLSAQLTEVAKSFNGDVGIYAQHLSTGEIVAINADTLFPTASMIKIPILVKIFDMIDKNELGFREELTWYADSINYPYDGGILWSFQEGKKISLDKVISLMITYSDNHASLWLQKIAGGTQINQWLADNGYAHTRVNSRTEGRKAAYQKYGWGQTTPREMAQLLLSIRKNKVISPTASEEMYRTLSKIYWDGAALSQIPPTVQSASKQGAVNESRSEVVLVNAPSGDYVFCVMTNHQKDQSWKFDNEGFVLIRSVSRIIWQHYEPDHPWEPKLGLEKY